MPKEIIETIFPSYREVGATIVISLLISLLIFITTRLLPPVAAFYSSLVFFAIGTLFLYYFLKKEGVIPLFFVLVALATMTTDDLGIFGWRKVLVLLLSGLVFDFLTFFFHRQSDDRSPVLAVSFSIACIPAWVVLIISSALTESSFFEILNLVSLSFLVGFVVSIIISLVWFRIRHLKSIIKLEMYLHG